MATLTPNYGLYLPAVNDVVDANIWGTQLNTNFSNLDTDLKAVSDVANAATPAIGMGGIWFTDTAPAKYILLQGQNLSRTTYSALFLAWGTLYGAGDGLTTFGVPDPTGRALAGKELVATRLTTAGCGVDGAALGASGGDQRLAIHTHTATQASHSHVGGLASPVSGTRYGVTDTGVSSAFFDSGVGTASNNGVNTSSATPIITVANAGTGSSANVQPTLIVNFIAYTGV